MKTRLAASAFDGEGARLYGGRWNSKGTRVAYAAESIAVAMLESLVHLQRPQVLESFSLINVQFPIELIENLDITRLPATWRTSPPGPEVQRIGDEWASQLRSVLLRVPSVIEPTWSNFLLNPTHPEFGKVTVGPSRPFEFDPRLLKIPGRSGDDDQ